MSSCTIRGGPGAYFVGGLPQPHKTSAFKGSHLKKISSPIFQAKDSDNISIKRNVQKVTLLNPISQFRNYSESILAQENLETTSSEIIDQRCNSKTVSTIARQNCVALLQMTEIEIRSLSDGAKVLSITPEYPINALCYAGVDETEKIPFLATSANSDGQKGIFQVWSLISGKEVSHISFRSPIFSIIHLEANLMGICFKDGSIGIWDCLKHKLLQVLETGQSYIQCFNKVGKEHIACGTNAGLIQVWRWSDKTKIFENSLSDKSDQVMTICSFNSNEILVGTWHGNIVKFDFRSNSKPGKIVCEGKLGTLLAMQQIGPTLFACGAFGTPFTVLDSTTWTAVFNGFSDSPYGFGIPQADGSFPLCYVEFENPAINSLVRCAPSSLEHPYSQISSRIYVGDSPRGSLFASICREGRLCIADDFSFSFSSFIQPIANFVYLKDNCIALFFVDSPQVAIWDCYQRKNIWHFQGGKFPVSLVYYEDQNLLECCFSDNSRQLWDWERQTKISETSVYSTTTITKTQNIWMQMMSCFQVRILQKTISHTVVGTVTSYQE